MDSDVSERANQSIQEYAQPTSIMGGIRGFKDGQWRWGQKASTET